MKTMYFFRMAALAATLCMGQKAMAQCTISNPGNSSGLGGSSNITQTFTTICAGSLTQATVNIASVASSSSSTSYTGSITANLRSGGCGGTVVGSATVSSLSNYLGGVTFNFSPAVAVTNATVYALELVPSNVPNSYPIYTTNNTNSYAGGQVYSNSCNSSTFAGTDLQFSINVAASSCTPPLFTTCPANQTGSAGANCTTIINYTATASSSPIYTYSFTGATTGSGSGTGTGAAFNKGATTVTITAANGCTPDATCTFIVTVLDNENPAITCPGNIIRNSATGTCGAVVTYAAPVGTDNCPGATTTQTTGLASGATFPVGITTNTFKVTDASGNIASCSFTVTVTDTTKPVVSGCPSNITLNNASQPATWTAPTATDNCGTVTTTSTHLSGSTFPVGTTMVTYTFTDSHSNVSTCSFTVTVTGGSSSAPIISGCPSDITVYTGPNSNSCTQAATWTPPAATSNCGTITGSSTHLPGATFPVGTTAVTYTFTCNNVNSTCSFIVTVIDTTKPVFAAADNVTAFSSANTCGTVVNYPVPSFTDNCSTCVLAVPPNYIYLGSFGGHTYYKSPSSDDWNNFEGFTFGVGGYLATINSAAENAFVADAVGVAAWIGFTDKALEGTFRWSDGEPVTYTNWCNGAPRGTATTSQDYTAINGGSGGCWEDYYSCCLPAIIEFNCNPFAERIAGPASGTAFPIGITTVTYRATDVSGNVSTTSFTVTVIDTVKPVLSPVNNINVAGGPPSCSVVVNYPIPTFTDNCPSCVAPVPSSYTYLGAFGGHTYYKSPSADDWNNFEGFGYGAGGYLATISSAAENEFVSSVAGGQAWIGFTDKTVEGTFRWSDGEPVTYTNWCNGAPRGSATTSQDYTAINGGADGCWEDYYSCCLPAIMEFNCAVPAQRIAGPASGSPFPVGNTTVTYRATDISGNISTTSFTVTVTDSTHTCNPIAARLAPANSNTEVKIYPNPSKGSFVVELPYTADEARIIVTDAQGKLITRKATADIDDHKVRFDLGGAARGMYFVEVIYGDQRFRSKVVVN